MTIETLRCQACRNEGLEDVLNLGYQPLCNEFLPSNEAQAPHIFYPLCLYYCPNCTLVQLGYVLPTEYTFGDQYTYLTGSSKSLINYYERLADRLVETHQLVPGDRVLEIGSNDGTFLKAFQARGMQVLGIEGANRASEVAVSDGVPTITRFFGKGMGPSIREHFPEGSRIRLILAMNVLAHTDNINEFLPEVLTFMEPDTVFVSSSHWLLELIQNFEFDTIYHEHQRYYTLGSLLHLFQRHGLNAIDAERTDFYGGSILVSARTGSTKQSEQVLKLLNREKQIDVPQALRHMKRELLINKARILNILVDAKKSGSRTVGIGAPMKASTLLNYYGITSDLVEYIGEVNRLKIGTAVPGVGIPVIHEDLLFEDQPDYALLLSWNMADDIIPKYRAKGYTGKFIVPVPEPRVIE